MALGVRSRVLLVLAALALLAAAAAAVPKAPVASPALPLPAVATPHATGRVGRPRLVAHRDPFAGGIEASPTPGVPSPLRPPLPPPPAALPILPPNDALRSVAPPSQVTAIVTGPRPSALVETGSGTVLVVPGSRLGEEDVVAIDLEGVRLGSGALLPLRTPAPEASPRAVR